MPYVNLAMAFLVGVCVYLYAAHQYRHGTYLQYQLATACLFFCAIWYFSALTLIFLDVIHIFGRA